MEDESRKFRDRMADLYVGCRCGKKEAYEELNSYYASSCSLSLEDALVVKGYLGDLLMLCDSLLIPRDEKRGKALLTELNQLDKDTLKCPHLQHLLGVYYQECCQGKESDMIELINKAALQGLPLSLSTMGYFYDYGIGVRQNVFKAFSFYKEAAEKGNPVAQCNIGKCYDTGEGCEMSSVKAAEWFKESASQGYSDALYNLGVFYQVGVGVDQNYETAVNYYEQAAIQGDRDAQYYLGHLYHAGRGVLQDSRKAVQLWELSCKRGSYSAALQLGLAYENGDDGININIVEAVRFYHCAFSLCSNEEKGLISQRLQQLEPIYREARYANRKSFLMLLWCCNFIYHAEAVESDRQSIVDHIAHSCASSSDNAVHKVFYIHDLLFVIMSFL